MKLSEFQFAFDNAPYELHEFALAACVVEDDEILRKAAKKFIEAQRQFEIALSQVDVEVG